MCEPQYQELLDQEIPRAQPEEGIVVKVMAGESYGVESKVYTRTPTMFLDFKMEPHKVAEQIIPSEYNGFIYMLSGTAFIGDSESGIFEGKAHHTLIFSEDEKDKVRIETRDEPAHFVFIAGQPLREPIVQHGPFVMNTNEEIHETFFDFRNALNGFERADQWRSMIE